LIELPISVTAGRVQVGRVWIQIIYPRARHPDYLPVDPIRQPDDLYRVLHTGDATAVVQRARMNSSDTGETFRAHGFGDKTMVEFGRPQMLPDEKLVLVDQVVYRIEELKVARFAGDNEAPGAVRPFRWLSERVNITLRSANSRERHTSAWLVAVACEAAARQEAVAFIAELLMRRDGLPIRKARPGGRVWITPRQNRKGLLVETTFIAETQSTAVSRITEGNIHIQDLEFTPVGNLESPVLIEEGT
jgi:hypothetical protein